MAKTTKTTKHRAFSLAETVITLLIIALVALGTIPVLTKKSRGDQTGGHGKWMCTLDSSGRHVKWETGDNGDPNNPSTWTSQGSQCTFEVPHQVNSFNVVVIGGGGGGAGAGSKSEVWDKSFAVEYYGKYRFLAVGGGGAGGKVEKKNKCKDSVGGSGASGEVGYLEYNIDKNVTNIKMTQGVGGKRDNGGDFGEEGTASEIIARKNTGDTTLIYAEGGGGGGKRKRSGGKGCYGAQKYSYQGKELNHKPKGASGLKSYNENSSDGATGNGRPNSDRYEWGSFQGGCISFSNAKALNKLLGYPAFIEKAKPPEFAYKASITYDTTRCHPNQPGRGGSGERGNTEGQIDERFGGDGNNGITIATTQLNNAGLGGEAGEIEDKFFYSFKESKISVIVGRGGAGGAASDDNGNNRKDGDSGNPSSFGNYFGASGGSGGSTTNQQQKAFEQVAGGNGEMTPASSYYSGATPVGLGGYTSGNSSANGTTGTGFGAGGGGGGVKPGEKPGKGADGAPGAVIIEW